MKQLFTFSLLLFTSYLSAQKSNWSISYTPALVEVPDIRYGLQLGAAYNLNPRLQLLTEITVAVGKTNNLDILNSRYIRVKPELRYFFPKINAPISGYLGLQLFYTDRYWTNAGAGSYFEESFNSDSVINYSSAKIHSPSLSETIQLGGLAKISKSFYLDVFMGMGAKSVFTKYSDINNPEKTWYQTPKCGLFGLNQAYRINATLRRFQMNMGFRVLYTF